MALGRVFSPLIVAVAVLLGFIAYINWPSEAVTVKQAPKATPVNVAVVSEQALPIVIEALGTANANESVTITAQQAEVIKQIAFDDGDFVSAEQMLVQLDDQEERSRVNELEVNLVEARRQLVRLKNLRKESATSEQLLDEQEARVKALEAQLQVARYQVNDLRINAPFAGKLGIRQVSLGSLVQPGDVITTLDDISAIKVDFSVAENHLASLSKGQRVIASSVAYPNEEFIGEISSIGSRVDSVTRSVLVRAIINNEDGKLRPGMLLQILLEKQVLQALVIPEKALVPQEDKQFVYIVDNGVVSQKEVTIGARRPGKVQIIDGLSPGQNVIVEGTLRVRDKSKVRVLNESGE